MKVSNTKQVIDDRINKAMNQMSRMGASFSAVVVVDTVYRPFCHWLAEMHDRKEPVEDVHNALISTIGNLIRETVMATSTPEDHMAVALAMAGDMIAALPQAMALPPTTHH